MQVPGTVRIACCRKLGDERYGSVGCELAVEISLDGTEDPITVIDQWRELLARTVAAHCGAELSKILAERQQEPPPARPSAPDRREPPRDQAGDRDRDRDRGRDRDQDDDTPGDGRQLLGWCRRQRSSERIEAWIKNEGRRRHLPTRIVDWPTADVREVYESIREQMSDRD